MATPLEKILVLGASGMLGTSLVQLLQSRGHLVELQSRGLAGTNQADMARDGEAGALLDRVRPNVIVNLIGLTNVDQCEVQPHQAYLANVRTVENVVKWAKAAKVPVYLVHLSTDQVYDGPGPHNEEMVSLTNYYGFSKYAGELTAKALSSAILRSNFFGRSRRAGRASLSDWLVNSVRSGQPISVFNDVLFTPLSLTTLAEMIELVIRKKPVGLFNVGSHGGMSKADFAFSLAEAMGLPTSGMTRTTTDQVIFLKAYRPKDMRMDSSRFEAELHIELPTLKQEIQRAAKDYYEVTSAHV
jgi:dTDP-4-dehydrorhamnose reductase